jgi:O-antigen biosynthesis protein
MDPTMTRDRSAARLERRSSAGVRRELPSRVRVSVPDAGQDRPTVRSKFLFVRKEKLYVRGVTYGTFRPNANGDEFPPPDVVERDFAQMAAVGLNAVRTYTLPPQSLLNTALRHGLRVMVGLCGERYIGYLIDRKGAPDPAEEIAARVRQCGRHPAVLCYAVANELPAPIVRWHGRRRIERYVERMFRAVKAEDPDALVTYVNFPTTEYLELPFLDLAAFNVYLERKDRLEAYLARLQNLVGERPLLMTELGLDSQRNGEHVQARMLEWQVHTAFAAGCAGTFVFAWTDEWYRGNEEVLDWDFGITARDRRPKLALEAVVRAFAEVPVAQQRAPRISVVVCTYNGARTIRGTLEGLSSLPYPDYEVIVVDDGSTDDTAEIAQAYDVRLVRTENRGLSSARNTGLAAATGEIVAYIDDDAYPDPHWLTYLAATFQSTDHAGVGGPNTPPPGDGPVAECVANAPGGPIHVLISDSEAEHIPGCNMAFRRSCLEAIGGFDAQFRAAGDDVDVCWRIRDRGWTLGFNPAAVVWHHRRNSVRAYWRQQLGYGRAEALLEKKWPERYNDLGHLSWRGRVYGKGLARRLGRAARIYHGVWGEAPFQSLYEPACGTFGALIAMPEWYLVILALAALSTLGAIWSPLLWCLPVLAFAVGASVVRALASASRASFNGFAPSRLTRWRLQLLTAFLHLLQPAARLRGRLKHGLSPWRPRGTRAFLFPLPRVRSIWSEKSEAAAARLAGIEETLRTAGAHARRGGHFDAWDLEVRGGLCGSARLLMAVEEHGGGRQYVRLRSWPRCSLACALLCATPAALAVVAALDSAWLPSDILAAASLILTLRVLVECGRAMAAIECAETAEARQQRR